MTNKESYGFVYIWRDSKHNRYYIGAHWGHDFDGYICSSRWMRKAYKRRPEDFKRKILKTNIITKENLLEEEFKWLCLIKKEELGKKYYNLRNCKFPIPKEEHTQETKEKHRQTMLKRLENPEYRQTLSDQMKGRKITWGDKISEAKIGQPSPMKGKKQTNEHKEKIRLANIGQKRSEEAKQKMRQAKLGKPLSEEHKQNLKGRIPWNKKK